MADTAEEGYQILREWRPDALVSDISMPGESGYEFIRRVRLLGRDGGGETPAIALTALAGIQSRDQALAAGFQVHISKPFEPNVLYEKLLGFNHSR
jgi:CheY-like chemotaxis protein